MIHWQLHVGRLAIYWWTPGCWNLPYRRRTSGKLCLDLGRLSFELSPR